MAETHNPPTDDAFFIGWEPMPISYVRLLRLVAIALVIVAAIIAAVVVLYQRPPGDAVWDDVAAAWEGVVVADPYALLFVRGDNDTTRTILLVEEGKFGAAERVRPFAGRTVRVTGTLLHRGARTMIEIAEGEDGIRPLGPDRAEVPEPRDLGPATLRGEIVDSKCYLGAMRPGGGKTHKACAALCLRGGVPPLLATRDADGREVFYLLTTANGGPAGAAFAPLAGETIEVTGRLRRWGDLLVLNGAAAP